MENEMEDAMETESVYRDPNSPMQIFADFKAQCRYYLYTWILRVKAHVLPTLLEIIKP